MNVRAVLSGGRSIAFVCERCGRPVYRAIDAPTRSAACPACGTEHALKGIGSSSGDAPLGACLRCGLERLYVQKDFNRKMGVAVFGVAAVLSVPTWGLSLLVATLVDLGLYYLLGDVAICYGCNTQHRGFRRNPAHGPFDLHVAEGIDRTVSVP
ncbi:MAG: hypothetical protein ACE5JH_11765 [Acidobacteriota bacterium]